MSQPASDWDNEYFTPESMIRRIHREALTLLGGGRAILLQLAHPFVAAGVENHSQFQSEILARLHRTLQFMQHLVFADGHHTRDALRQFHAVHHQIRGHLSQKAGKFPTGTPYSGSDPQTKLWVHATSVDTSLRVYEQFVTALTREERRMYYADTCILARLMAIPDAILPSTLDEFDEYMQEMLCGETLEVTSTARRLARAVLYPQVGLLPGLSAALLRTVTVGILPERIRGEYGLIWNRKRRYFLRFLSMATRSVRPVAPAWVWKNPLMGGKLAYFLLWGFPGTQTQNKQLHSAAEDTSFY